MRLLACLATLCLTASVALATPPQAEARAGANPGARAVADHVPDGDYLLELQLAHFMNDASPSRPLLYTIIR